MQNTTKYHFLFVAIRSRTEHTARHKGCGKSWRLLLQRCIEHLQSKSIHLLVRFRFLRELLMRTTNSHFACVLFCPFFCRRTNSDILELSEISLDLNLVNNNIRFKFTDSPILAVSIAEIDENVIVLVATVSSIHQLKFASPLRIHKSNDETQSFSVFHEAATQTSRDPSASLFYVIGHAATPRKLIHM